MAIIEAKTERGFRAGHFLASADCERKTYSVPVTIAKATDTSSVFSAGDVLRVPAGGGNYAIIGICYEDVAFKATETEENCILSVVTKGTVYAEKLTYIGEEFGEDSAITFDAAKEGLEALGIKVITAEMEDEGHVTRPFTE